ncbi:hypothetical protein FSP39_006014 [Pinctada imbricata]|uniref:Mpv17-like protein 2 n=1 Tax=Pinctada imbricata TaxID=66713 RepID=A0AA89BLL5_PINIB|nr:hypothetical protein FSP39_006014 [Pinctada imbricata]
MQTAIISVKKIAQKGRILFSSKYLLYTNVGISIASSALGDVIVQSGEKVSDQSKQWDKIRTAQLAVTGAAIGPFCHYWYIFLDWYLPGKTGRILVKKLLLDQFVCSPVVIGSFLGMTCYMEGKTVKDMKTEMKEKGATLYITEWLVWPPAQVINFCFLPTRFRVLYDSSISLGFDCYYSKVKYGKNS